MELVTMKCEDGTYFARGSFDSNGQRLRVDTKALRFNGGENKVKDTWNPRWHLLEGADSIHSVESLKKGSPINPRWELVEFSVEDMGSISVENVNNFEDTRIIVNTISNHGTDYESENIEQDLSSIVTYSELERMLVPELAIHNRPCSLSADVTYKIIRSHVKNNIVGSEARVTSDYNFCFTVKKELHVKPYVHKTEIKKANGGSYAKPRYNTKVVASDLITAFEMCPSKPYQGYTPIKGFSGDSLKDLAENIKLYLDELMGYLNTPLNKCLHCGGTGVTVKPFDANKR